MRIAHHLATFIAVLAAVVLPNCGAQNYNNNSHASLRRPARSLPHSANSVWDGEDEAGRNRGWHKTREWQDIVRRESVGGGPVDCCPSDLEMVEPMGGKNREDMFVELYSDGETRQRFYEVSCRKDVENRPCRFVDRKMYNQSKCVQKYTYTYALVRDLGGEHHQRSQRHFPPLPAPGGGWTMDYIQIRSACACEFTPKPNQRRHHGRPAANKRQRNANNNHNNHHHHQHQHQHQNDQRN